MLTTFLAAATLVLSIWPVLNRQGNDLQRQRRWAEATSRYREALRLAPHTPLAQATLRNNLGTSLLRQGNYDEAMQELKLALKLWDQVQPPLPGERVRALSNLAACESLRGQPARAITYLEEALSEGETPERGAVLVALASAANNAGLADSARLWIRQALEWRSAHGLNDSDDAALTSARCGIEGGMVCDEAVRSAERSSGSSASLATLLQRRSVSLLREGRFDDAAADLLRAAVIQREDPGPQSLVYGRTLQLLAIVRAQQNRVQQALALLDQSEPIFERYLAPDAGERLQVLQLRGDLLRRQGDLNGAEAILRDLARRPGVTTLRGEVNNTLGAVLYDQQRYSEAAAAFRQALDDRRANRQDRTLVHADTLQNLALTLFRAGQREAACEAQQESIRLREQIAGPAHGSLATGMDIWAQLLEKAGRKKEAKQARERASLLARQDPGASQRAGVVSLRDLKTSFR